MRALTLIDWKSSKAVYDEYKQQVAAYAEAYNLRAIKEGRPRVSSLMVLRLDKETGMPEPVDVTDGWEDRYESFIHLRNYYKVAIEMFLTEESKARSRDRYYSYGDQKFPSVTTILSILSKPALIQWSANMAVEFITDAITEIRNPDTNELRISQILKKARTAHRDAAKKAADIGTLVHDAIEVFLAGGDPAPIISDSIKATTAFSAFIEWKDAVKMEVVELEQPVYHPVHRYAGTPDLIAWIDTTEREVSCQEQENGSQRTA